MNPDEMQPMYVGKATNRSGSSGGVHWNTPSTLELEQKTYIITTPHRPA